VHGNRRYVKLAERGADYREVVRRVVLPLLWLLLSGGGLLLSGGVARAETVYPGQVTDARLALGPADTPVVAYVLDANLVLATRGPSGWTSSTVSLRRPDIEIDGLAFGPNGVSALLRARDGTWLGLWDSQRLRSFHRDSGVSLFGPAGLALDRQQRPVVAYAVWFPSHKTYLRLVRTDAKGKLVTTRVTRKGFPPTSTLAAAAPVVLGSGAVHVVETYLPAAIEWRPIPGDWMGQFLHITALGAPTGGIIATAVGKVVYAAWTETFPTLGPPGVVLAVHSDRARSSLALENAVLAGLALTPDGPELAANRCVPPGVCGGLVADTGVDGVVAGFATGQDGTRDLLLATDAGLEWFRSPGPLDIRVTLTPELTGRVDGATGGSVLLYRERPGSPRTLLGSFPLAADGSFTASDPTASPVASAYRAVYTAITIPYAALVGSS
jgi:hypothetical protein